MDGLGVQIELTLLFLSLLTVFWAALRAFHSQDAKISKLTEGLTATRTEKIGTIVLSLKHLWHTVRGLTRANKTLTEMVREDHTRILEIQDRLEGFRKLDNEVRALHGLMIDVCERLQVLRGATNTGVYRSDSKSANHRSAHSNLCDQERALVLDVYYGLAVTIGGEVGTAVASAAVRVLLKVIEA
jgi:hypothetical protein